jgi:hypothetical protein
MKGGTDPALEPLYDEAIRDTIARFEAFDKITARVAGTALASKILGGG